MPYNSNTLFQKMPDKVSFFYAQMSEKWLKLSLKKFPSYIFRNNVESETVLYLTNGRKKKLENGTFKVGNSKKIDGNYRAVIVDTTKNNVRVEDVTLKKVTTLTIPPELI
ncbi:hypothetical protein [Streptococcus sp.]|uniref:hypothetical protein n=1 Tax=Streptococcus sp. TaxID=1306 RepID=UPI003995CB61